MRHPPDTQSSYLDLKEFYKAASIEEPSSRIYCLADHAGIRGLHRQLMRSHVQCWNLFEGSREENALDVAPLLFAMEGLEKTSGQLLRWIAEHGTFTSSIMFLRSPLEAPELARRLRLRLQGRISEDMDVMLRFFDCRVFESLMQVLSERQQTVFLGAADGWWYVNRHGRLVQQSAAFQQNDDFSAPLLLTAAQEFALLDLSEPDQVAAQLLELMPEQYLVLGAAHRASFVERHIAEAKEFGVTVTHELVLYCGMALLHGEGFAFTEAWQPLLARVRAGLVSLSDAVVSDENIEQGL